MPSNVIYLERQGSMGEQVKAIANELRAKGYVVDVAYSCICVNGTRRADGSLQMFTEAEAVDVIAPYQALKATSIGNNARIDVVWAETTPEQEEGESLPETWADMQAVLKDLRSEAKDNARKEFEYRTIRFRGTFLVARDDKDELLFGTAEDWDFPKTKKQWLADLKRVKELYPTVKFIDAEVGCDSAESPCEMMNDNYEPWTGSACATVYVYPDDEPAQPEAVPVVEEEEEAEMTESKVTKINYFAPIDTMGDVTEIEASNYRSWAHNQLTEAFPEAVIEVVSDNSTITSIIESDNQAETDRAISFCRELWDRAPWPEEWSRELKDINEAENVDTEIRSEDGFIVVKFQHEGKGYNMAACLERREIGEFEYEFLPVVKEEDSGMDWGMCGDTNDEVFEVFGKEAATEWFMNQIAGSVDIIE